MNDTHAIPAADEPVVDVDAIHNPESPDYLTDKERERLLCFLIGASGRATAAGRIDYLRRLRSGPAKTHDLAVRRPDGNAMIVVEGEEDAYRLHIPGPEAEILGQILKILTPAQVAILADALADGAL